MTPGRPTPLPVSSHAAPAARPNADIDAWIKTTRRKVMYRDESRVD